MKKMLGKLKKHLSNISKNLSTTTALSEPIYRIASIEKDKHEDYEITVQLIGKSSVFKMKPEEILADDNITDQFSPRDVRALTYLGYLDINSPKYRILAKRLSEKDNKILFALHKRGEKNLCIKTASEISQNKDILKQMDQQDAHMVGFITANDEMLRENVTKENIIKQQKNVSTNTEKNDFALNNSIMQLTQGFILSKTLLVFAELGLHQYLSDKPIAIDQLAKQLKLDNNALFHFLRFLDAYEIIELSDDKTIKNTCCTSALKNLLSPHLLDGYKLMDGLLYTLKNNKECWTTVFGCSFYEYMDKNLMKWEQFEKWCANTAQDWLQPILSLCDFSTYQKVVDIGGGQGHLLISILKKHPNTHGILFDLPPVISKVKNFSHHLEIKDRLSFIAGDFFSVVPKGIDLYLIARVLLNWTNEQATDILSICKKAMASHSELWIIDFIIPEKTHPLYKRSVLKDIDVLTSFSSAIRTIPEWRQLIQKAGLELINIAITPPNYQPEPYLPIGIFKTKKF